MAAFGPDVDVEVALGLGIVVRSGSPPRAAARVLAHPVPTKAARRIQTTRSGNGNVVLDSFIGPVTAFSL
jgi:hypothetical protein